MSEMLEPYDFPAGEIVAEIYFHIIFWTRELQPALSREMLANACEAMDQAMFTVEGEALAAGGAENHLHVLARLSPDHSVQEAIDTLRQRSAAMVAPGRGMQDFSWHESEVAVSISPDDLGRAREFIEQQALHHETVTFQIELTGILDEHGFDYDERDLWGPEPR
jgi:REP element-mobilizing transposase RayT